MWRSMARGWSVLNRSRQAARSRIPRRPRPPRAGPGGATRLLLTVGHSPSAFVTAPLPSRGGLAEVTSSRRSIRAVCGEAVRSWAKGRRIAAGGSLSTAGTPRATAAGDLPSGDAQKLAGADEVARLDPENHPVASGAGADGVEGDDVDLRVAQLPHHLGDGADAVLALDQERALGPHELPAGLMGDPPEGPRVVGDEVELGPPPLGEAREGQEIHPLLLERRERPRPLPWPIGHLNVEVVDAANRVSHALPPRRGQPQAGMLVPPCASARFCRARPRSCSRSAWATGWWPSPTNATSPRRRAGSPW